MHFTNRRDFLKSLGALSGAGIVTSFATAQPPVDKLPFFKISLAEWSLNKMIKAGGLKNLDFPAKARKDFGITAVEYVTQLFTDKGDNSNYLNELKQRCSDNGVTSVLIMVDREGDLADLDANVRNKAVENHYKWADAAKLLGCHSIRVNCAGKGSREEVARAGMEGLRKLSEYAAKSGINVIVENHGGYSSDGKWLSNVISSVNLPNCGTLPDFGNFCIRSEKVGDKTECVEKYDRYQGVAELMPFAKGVSAKSHDFDEKGNCIETDYARMLGIVKKAGYNNYIGIEYEGSKLSEEEGIRATLKLLQKVGAEV